jgi:hypothetical protein
MGWGTGSCFSLGGRGTSFSLSRAVFERRPDRLEAYPTRLDRLLPPRLRRCEKMPGQVGDLPHERGKLLKWRRPPACVAMQPPFPTCTGGSCICSHSSTAFHKSTHVFRVERRVGSRACDPRVHSASVGFSPGKPAGLPACRLDSPPHGVGSAIRYGAWRTPVLSPQWLGPFVENRQVRVVDEEPVALFAGDLAQQPEPDHVVDRFGDGRGGE